MKKFFIVLTIFSSFFIYGRDVTEVDVGNKNAWHEELDLSDKKPGKYNFLITVTGNSGNQVQSGPFNMFIDPESDLPVSSITNPVSSVAIPGNLNIIGTCVDDDGVDHVDLILDGNDSNIIRAEGADYWSYYLDTTGLSEGIHTITAIGTDVNGLQGHPTTIEWNLNRSVPDTFVSNYPMGTLFSKIIKLRGSVADGNGIKALYYSLDKGVNYKEVKLERSKSNINFSLEIDSRKLPDGPTVVWFKAVDNWNTEGIYTYLFFVDNTVPEVAIISPKDNETPNGVFSVAGYARDAVGIKSISWTMENESGSFDLIPGNPYWCKEFDTTKTAPSSVHFSVTATDLAGNIVTVQRNIKLNQEEDKPVLTIQSPTSKTLGDKENSVVFRGIALDDDGVESVVYSLDNGAEQTILTHGVFSVPLDADEMLSAGKHTVSAYAIDKFGVKGNKVSATFMAKGPEGSFADANIKETGKEKNSVAYGMQINPSLRPVYETSVFAACGISSYEWTVKQSSEIVLSDKREFSNFPVNLPISIPLSAISAGATEILIQAKDRYGRPLEQFTTVGIMNYTKETGASAVSVPPETPPKPIGDITPPILNIESPENSSWIRSSITIHGTASDDGGLARIEYSTNNGESWNECSMKRTAGSKKGAVFSAEVPHPTEDGLLSVDIRAVDESGNEAFEYLSFFYDVTPPVVEKILPLSSDLVNGGTLMVFKATDNGSLVKGTYLPPEKKDKKKEEALTVVTYDFSKSNNNKHKEDNFVEIDLSSLVQQMVGTDILPIDNGMSFSFFDEAGNETTIKSWDFEIDNQSDLPVAEIHLPAEDSVITQDFIVSGVLYDDDGKCTYFYKIDDNPWIENIIPDTSFSFSIPLYTLSDNEHTISIYAVDTNDVKGEVATRKIKVSKAEPEGTVTAPALEHSVRGDVLVTGTASDKNGIEKVLVSLDNGNSYSLADGTENWSFRFDSHIFSDGSHVLFYKIYDKYGIQGLYSHLINIDNTPPELSLMLPKDGSTTSGIVFFSGSTIDNIKLNELYLDIHSLTAHGAEKQDTRITLDNSQLFSKPVDISAFEDGLYNFELFGKDAAGNETRISRNVFLDKTIPPAHVSILYPFTGSYLNGSFIIAASVECEKTVDSMHLFMDDVDIASSYRTVAGYCQFKLTSENVAEGEHRYKIRAILTDGTYSDSLEQTLTYSKTGPWIFIEGLDFGDFATDRPYLSGSAGYSVDSVEKGFANSKTASADVKAAVNAKCLEKIEISLDNGKTYTELSRSEDWKYRIENDFLEEGYHYILVRAVMKNGEIAVARTIVQIDKSLPDIKLVTPGEGSRYNQKLTYSGLANDENGVKEVKLSLRSGDKMMYEIPGFIQGLYFDVHFWGATLYDVGVGLTFFDDNVKLQLQWGQFTETQYKAIKGSTMRYGGNVLGAKILANVAYIPFMYFLGPDFMWLSANIAIGANFSRFDYSQSGKAQVLSAMLTQLEFPRITFDKAKLCKTVSFYTELQLWFIPTDISTVGTDVQNIVPQIGWGVRLNVF